MSKWHEILELQNSRNPPRLDKSDAEELYMNADFNDLLYVAHERRNLKLPGNSVTYLVDRNINYTNVCTINCQFCSFYRPPGHSETYLQSLDQISERIIQLEDLGGSRVLMQGGVHPELNLEWYTDLICLLYTSPSPRDKRQSRMPSSA